MPRLVKPNFTAGMGPEISPSEITDSHFVSLYFLKNPIPIGHYYSAQDYSEIWPVSGQISVRQYVGCCLTCLFYCGTVSKSFILETLVENLSLLFLGKIFLNTLSSVFYRGLLGDYYSAVTVSPHGRFGGAPGISPSSGAGIWCSLRQDVHGQEFCPSV